MLPDKAHKYNPYAYEYTWESPKFAFYEFNVNATFDIQPDELEEEKNHEPSFVVEGSLTEDWQAIKNLDLENCPHVVRGKLRHKGYSTVIQSLIEIGLASHKVKIDHHKTKFMRQLVFNLSERSEVVPQNHDFTLDKFKVDKIADRELLSKLLSMTSFTYLGDIETVVEGWLYFELLNSTMEIPNYCKTGVDVLAHIAKEKITKSRGTEFIIINQSIEIEKVDRDIRQYSYSIIKKHTQDIIFDQVLSIKNLTLGYAVGIPCSLILENQYFLNINEEILNKYERLGIKFTIKHKL